MAPDDPDTYFVHIESTLAGRPAGGSAASKAAELRHEAPVRSWVGRILGIRTDERAWSKGAEGERLVARELAKLSSSDWVSFHDLPIGTSGANVDHLVIGAGGVFSMNAKHLSGRVWVGEHALLVNGRRTDYLAQAHREGRRVSACLSRAIGYHVPVRAVVVVICDEFTVKHQPEDVDVVGRKGLASWLRAQPRVLSRAEILSIAGVAHRPETWT